MPITPSPDKTEQLAPPHRRARRRRLIGILLLLLALLLIAFLTPLINVSRFQKRIAANISSALGRPVHFDQVALTLFPLPGFTLTHFVIDEDPAFGYEPLLRADQVDVTLRISSLWHSHTEFSKIAFTEPSVNLVHNADGRWNIESLLLQASHIQAAPTAQRFAGPARRFPYIEATGARLNLKLDQEKSPVSFTDADFALWLPEPRQWRIRLEAHPMRTDSSPGDTGTVRAEGTLGGGDGNSNGNSNATSLSQIPVNLHGDWRDAQLGGLSRLLIGRDPGLRGDFSLSFTLAGTIGQNAISTHLKLAGARRADFVPEQTLSLEASCNAAAGQTFHSFTSIDCHWPSAASSDPPIVALTASLPDIRQLETATATLTLPSLPSDSFFEWLSVATPHPPAVLGGAGTLSGTLTWGPRDSTIQSGGSSGYKPTVRSPSAAAALHASTNPILTGAIRFTGGSLILDPETHHSLPLGAVVLSSTNPAPAPPHSHSLHTAKPAATPAGFDLQPLPLDLDPGETDPGEVDATQSDRGQAGSSQAAARQPAILTGHFDANGYTLRLTGPVLLATLRQMAKAVPQFGDNLAPLLDQLTAGQPKSAARPASVAVPGSTRALRARAAPPIPASSVVPAAPITIDLTATRTWGGPQLWTQTTPPTLSHLHRRPVPHP